MNKTGMIVTAEDENRWSEEDMAEWNAAIDDY
jgi:hypothetical protein